MQLERMQIPGGDAGTKATVAQMVRLIRAGSVVPLVRMTAVELMRPLPPRAYDRQITTIRRWCEQHIQFLRDPRGTELLHAPAWMLEQVNSTGRTLVDCDDAAILSGALALSIGLRVRIVTVAFIDKSAPFAHTFAEVASPVGPAQWGEMDVTRSAQQIDPSLISRWYIVEV